MSLHKGKILQNAIKESGMTVIKIVEKMKEQHGYMKCSRTRLYHLFKQKEIDDAFLLKIGRIIYYDFSKDIPELAKSGSLSEVSESDQSAYYKKAQNELYMVRKEHNRLQKNYINLLALLTKVANKNKDDELKKAIAGFLIQVDEAG